MAQVALKNGGGRNALTSSAMSRIDGLVMFERDAPDAKLSLPRPGASEISPPKSHDDMNRERGPESSISIDKAKRGLPYPRSG